MPPGSTSILQKLPGYSDFDSLREVLELLRCGFGLKDAPRLWNKVLRQLLIDLGMRPLQSDEQLFVWHDEADSRGQPLASPDDRSADQSLFAPTCKLVLSTHVDDLKGAGQPKYRDKLIAALTQRFGQLKMKHVQFECVGVMHEQSKGCTEVWTHQQHYVPQIKQITIGDRHIADDEVADDDMKQLYMPLVGALAWLILTMPSVCVYVAFLQRHTDSQPLSQSLREIETLSMTMAAESILYVHQTSPNKSIQRAPDGNAAQDEAMLALELQLTLATQV